MKKGKYLAILILLIVTNSSLTASAYSVSQEGLRFIAEQEGTEYSLYNDPAGHCTIGTGHLVHTGNCDGSDPSEQEFLEGITGDQALELLRADVAIAEEDVNSQVTVPLTQSQFDALVSFAYNLGGVNLATMLSDSGLNEGNYCSVPAELNRWVHGEVNGEMQILPGLVTRRSAEGDLFRSGISESCVSGEWNLQYHWNNDADSDAGDAVLAFKEDGTLSAIYDSRSGGLGEGKWTQIGNNIHWEYGDTGNAIYDGIINDNNNMQGTISTTSDSSVQGEWSAYKRYTDPGAMA